MNSYQDHSNLKSNSHLNSKKGPPQPPVPEKVRIGTDTITSLRPSKTLCYHKNADITSIDFDDTGSLCLSAAEDESIMLYDMSTGTRKSIVYSKKYGVALAKFTHSAGSSSSSSSSAAKGCIYASTKVDNTIRYVTFHDNSFVRYFKGHEKQVHSIEVSPLSDAFLSSAADDTVKIWDMRSPTVQGSLKTPSPIQAVYDPTNVLFCVASEETKSLSLYDIRNFDKQPFSLFKLDSHGRSWSKVEFSNDGKFILVSTYDDTHFVLDSFTGELYTRLVGHVSIPRPNQRNTGHTCFSQDGRFVFSGSGNKKVYIWDLMKKVDMSDGISKLKPIAAIDSPTPPALLAMSPQMMVLATGNHEVTFWLPDTEGHDKQNF